MGVFFPSFFPSFHKDVCGVVGNFTQCTASADPGADARAAYLNQKLDVASVNATCRSFPTMGSIQFPYFAQYCMPMPFTNGCSAQCGATPAPTTTTVIFLSKFILSLFSFSLLLDSLPLPLS